MTGRKNIYVVAIVALIALAGCSSNDNSPSPTAIDTAPPAMPVDLSGQLNNTTVVLNWTANTTDADLAGYKVYRENGGRVAALASSPLTQNRFEDSNPMINAVNVYRVSAVDLDGNESTYTSVQVAVELEDLVARGLHPVDQ